IWEQASAYIERFFERFAGVRQFMDDTRALAREKGYVETLYGRRLYLPEINARNGMRRAAAERTAINAPLQGTAADLIKKAMIDVAAWLAHSGEPWRTHVGRGATGCAIARRSRHRHELGAGALDCGAACNGRRPRLFVYYLATYSTAISRQDRGQAINGLQRPCL